MISRVRLLNGKLSTRGAAGLVVTEIDLETSAASACRIQSSELGLLPELGLRNYSYCSSHAERCCRFPALKLGL
eukprot:9477184-Pyramimonas_sp.AAC.1